MSWTAYETKKQGTWFDQMENSTTETLCYQPVQLRPPANLDSTGSISGSYLENREMPEGFVLQLYPLEFQDDFQITYLINSTNLAPEPPDYGWPTGVDWERKMTRIGRA